jgi:heptose I phosphotransferase
MTHGTLIQRLTRGSRWVWLSEAHREALPGDLAETVMAIESRDRFHAKQGRSTARVRFDSARGPLAVYLKRHHRLPWGDRLRALIDPGGHHSPASAEFAHLEMARALGIAVPEAVAAGERIGPWGHLESFLMVAELTGCRELNEVLPGLAGSMTAGEFHRLKRSLVGEMAAISAKLHNAGLFHKDLYLCHFFLDRRPGAEAGRRLVLIDLHRLARHRLTAARWRWKDLGQLLYSTFGVGGITDRDRLRFWAEYRRLTGLRWAGWQRGRVESKARRYLRHNRAAS